MRGALVLCAVSATAAAHAERRDGLVEQRAWPLAGKRVPARPAARCRPEKGGALFGALGQLLGNELRGRLDDTKAWDDEPF
jgi:hypothetical protein